MLTNVELDHHATFASLDGAARGVSRVPRGPPARGHRVGPARAARAAPRRARRARLRRRASVAPDRRGLELSLARRAGAPGRARRAQRAQRRRRARSGAAGRRATPPRAIAGLAGFHGAGRRFQLLGRSARGALRVRRLRPPPDGGRRDARRGAHAGARAAAWRCSSRICTRAPRCSRATSAARWRTPTWSSCSTCTRRASAPRIIPASAACSIAEAAADAAHGRPVYWLPTLRRRRGRARRAARRRRRVPGDGRRRRRRARRAAGGRVSAAGDAARPTAGGPARRARSRA